VAAIAPAIKCGKASQNVLLRSSWFRQNYTKQKIIHFDCYHGVEDEAVEENKKDLRDPGGLLMLS
jgi:hypothetical protein